MMVLLSSCWRRKLRNRCQQMTTGSDSRTHINLSLCPTYAHSINFHLNLACTVHAWPHCICVLYSCMLCKQSTEVVGENERWGSCVLQRMRNVTCGFCELKCWGSGQGVMKFDDPLTPHPRPSPSLFSIDPRSLRFLRRLEADSCRAQS